MVAVTKLVVVNKSKGPFLLSDLSAPSQTQTIMEVIHDPCTHDKSPCRGPEFVQLSDLAAVVTQQGPVVIYVCHTQLCCRQRQFKQGDIVLSATSLQYE